MKVWIYNMLSERFSPIGHDLYSTCHTYSKPCPRGMKTTTADENYLNLNPSCENGTLDLKRRCTPDCIFAPHFPSNDPLKFAILHKVLGACNVSKILIQVPIELHKNTVNMLTFVADARLRNPVYGCFGAFVLLQRKMTELQHDLAIARSHSSIRCCPELHAFQLQSSKLQSGVTRA
ncbi:LOB domain-containing protein 21-like [Tripterygium wilfordii]|uniref:LOB domain-containing protein 21-like n=1 Tax=Tripterygium wilfordii TaxID=458696 RepID=UPI0018F83427|nr:LOB domain-containing protein 21-like [Tripterygium wilfordii]